MSLPGDQNNLTPEKKKFNIEDLPEPTRRFIWKLSIIVIMVPVVIIWVVIAKKNFTTESKNNYGLDDWRSISEKINELSEETTTDLNAAKENLGLMPGSSSTDQVTKDLNESLTADWPTYHNSLGAFQIKFPPQYHYVEPTATGTDLLVSFFQPEIATATLELYRYQNIDDFTNKPNLKKYWPAGYFYIVAVGATDATATPLILDTFELGPQNY
ncbi:MAG: hypothetical protein PHW95_04175 [Patescibacteria group bacterium]|nr:hypothetical protein [Patescibacteria group bacterium]